LNVTNTGVSAFTAGDSFKLFAAENYAGAFANLVLPPLPANLAWNTHALNLNGTLSVIAVPGPVIGPVSISGGSLIFTGSAGAAYASYYLLATTNLAVPVANWTRLLTNQFDAAGNFNFIRPLNPDSPPLFYRLQVP
jgi:hypothetical protein